MQVQSAYNVENNAGFHAPLKNSTVASLIWWFLLASALLQMLLWQWLNVNMKLYQ